MVLRKRRADYSTRPTPDSSVPLWIWRASWLTLLAVLVGTGTLLALILGGIADPKPLGRLSVQDDLNTIEGWTTAPDQAPTEFEPGTVRLSAPDGHRRAYLIAPYSVHTPATIELIAQQVSGPADAGYGLWWGKGSDEPHMIAAVNGNTYYTLLKFDGKSLGTVFDWQTFPWLLLQGETNRIRVDLQGQDGILRLNDELGGAFEWSGDEVIQVGLVILTSERGKSTAAFDRLTIWETAP